MPAGNAGLAQDCETLLSLMDTLRGSASLNWSATEPIKGWDGVRTAGTPKRVTIIRLQKQKLDGGMPPAIGQLDKLVDIWLYSNKLQGPLPAELGNLSDLKTLMLGWNSLSGQIPQELNNLTLDRLWLRGNSFSGCIPYNLTLVADNDLGAVNLPACDPPGPPPPPPPPPPSGSETLSDMVEDVRSSVVLVKTVDYGSPWSGVATGFIFRVDDDRNNRAAYILTNQHVVEEAESVAVLVDDRDWYQADILSLDPRRDIAMLRICCSQHFRAVEFMDTTPMRAGDEVVTVGYPADRSLPGAPPRTALRIFELPEDRKIIPGEATVTKGIISAFRYSTSQDAQVVQIDAATTWGSSGSPIFTRDGLVVGMNAYGIAKRPAEDIVIPVAGLNFGILETTIHERVRLWDVGPSAGFGPLSGGLRHDDDEYIEQFGTEFTADSDEFVLEATFVNPYGADEHPWSYGFTFGRTGEDDDEHVWLVVNSNGTWRIDTSTTRLHGGLVPQLLTGAGQKNRVTLYVDGRYGWLYVNGQKVLDEEGAEVSLYGQGIDLGGEHVTSHEGSVTVVTGFFTGDERAGAVTRYEGFRGWTYDHSR